MDFDLQTSEVFHKVKFPFGIPFKCENHFSRIFTGEEKKIYTNIPIQGYGIDLLLPPSQKVGKHDSAAEPRSLLQKKKKKLVYS